MCLGVSGQDTVRLKGGTFIRRNGTLHRIDTYDTVTIRLSYDRYSDMQRGWLSIEDAWLVRKWIGDYRKDVYKFLDFNKKMELDSSRVWGWKLK